MSFSVSRIWDFNDIVHRVTFYQDVRTLIGDMEKEVRECQRQSGISFADSENDVQVG